MPRHRLFHRPEMFLTMFDYRTRTDSQDLSTLPPGVSHPRRGAGSGLLRVAARAVREVSAEPGELGSKLGIVSMDRCADHLGLPDRGDAALGPLGSCELATTGGAVPGDEPGRRRPLVHDRVPMRWGRRSASSGTNGCAERGNRAGMGRIRADLEPDLRLPRPPGRRSRPRVRQIDAIDGGDRGHGLVAVFLPANELARRLAVAGPASQGARWLARRITAST